jgi:hypothetical protein
MSIHSNHHSLAFDLVVAGVPRPEVSEAERQVAGVRAAWPQPAVVQVEVPPTQAAAAQEREDSSWEQNTAAKPLPIVVVA